MIDLHEGILAEFACAQRAWGAERQWSYAMWIEERIVHKRDRDREYMRRYRAERGDEIKTKARERYNRALSDPVLRARIAERRAANCAQIRAIRRGKYGEDARQRLLAAAREWRHRYMERETPEQREARLALARERTAARRARETPEQREERKAKDREYHRAIARAKRAAKGDLS